MNRWQAERAGWRFEVPALAPFSQGGDLDLRAVRQARAEGERSVYIYRRTIAGLLRAVEVYERRAAVERGAEGGVCAR